MSPPATPEIRRLTPDLLEKAVRIHMAGMGYTLNARLGKDHLTYLYARMAVDPDCYTGVALVDGRLAGVVSGSIDAAAFSSRLTSSMPAARLVRTGIRLLTSPKKLRLLVQGSWIARPVWTDLGEVRAVLTAIVVDTRTQGRGIGRALVTAFEAFLRGAGVQEYRLDTQIKNRRAAQFYIDLGFTEVARRADSIVFVRML